MWKLKLNPPILILGLILIVPISAQSNVYSCTHASPCSYSTITCPSNSSCTVSCSDPSTCQTTSVICPTTQYDCSVTCLGTSSCQSLTLTCGGGPCNLQCIGDSSCQYALPTCNATAANATASSSYPLCTSNCVGSMTNLRSITNIGGPEHSCHTTCPLMTLPASTSTCDNITQWTSRNPVFPPPPNTSVNCTEVSSCQITSTRATCPVDTPHCQIDCWGQSSCQISDIFCPVTDNSDTSCQLSCLGLSSCQISNLHCNNAKYPDQCQVSCPGIAGGQCGVTYVLPWNCTTPPYPSTTITMYSHTPLNPSQWIFNSACSASTSFSVVSNGGYAYGIFIDPLNGTLYGAPHFISSYIVAQTQNISYTVTVTPNLPQQPNQPRLQTEHITIDITLMPHPTILSMHFGTCDTCLVIELVNSTSLILPTSYPQTMDCNTLLNSASIDTLGGISGMTCTRNAPYQININMNPSNVGILPIAERTNQPYQRYLTINSGILMSNPSISSTATLWQGVIDPSTVIENTTISIMGTLYQNLTSTSFVPSPLQLCYAYHAPLVFNVLPTSSIFLRPATITRYYYIVNGTNSRNFPSSQQHGTVGMVQATDFISPGNMSIMAIGTSSLGSGLHVDPYINLRLIQPNNIPSGNITKINNFTFTATIVNLPTNCDPSTDTTIYYDSSGCNFGWVWSIYPATDGLDQDSLASYVTATITNNYNIPITSTITIPNNLLSYLPSNYAAYKLSAQFQSNSQQTFATWCTNHPYVANSISTIPVQRTGNVTTSPSSSSKLSTGAIVGIVIGCAIGGLLIALLILYIWRRYHQPSKTVIQLTEIETKTDAAGTTTTTTTSSKDETIKGAKDDTMNITKDEAVTVTDTAQ